MIVSIGDGSRKRMRFTRAKGYSLGVKMNALTYKKSQIVRLMRSGVIAPAVSDHNMLAVRRCTFENNQ